MEIVIKSFGHLNGHSHEDPRLHAYGSESVSPYYINIMEPGTYKIPISKPCTLCFQLFTLQKTDERKWAHQRTGHAFITEAFSGEKRIDLLADDGSTVIGGVTLSLMNPSLIQSAPAINIGARTISEYASWSGRYKPAHPELEQVHVDQLQNLVKPNLPGFAFSLLVPKEYEDEVLFERAALICMNRRGLKNLERDMDRALILADTLQCIVSFNRYTQDIEHVGRKRVAVDRFSADIRVCDCGDCEDQAHECVVLWRSLRRLKKPKSLIVEQLRHMACQYIALEILGTISLPYDPRLQVYSTGTMYAHAWCMIFPNYMFRSLITPEIAMDSLSTSTFTGAPILTIDSTRNNDCDYRKPTYPWTCPIKTECVRGIEAIEPKHYLFLSTAYVLDGLVYAGTQTQCPEVYFLNRKGERGCAYDSIEGVSIQPTVIQTVFQKLESAIRSTLRLFHPLPQYDTQSSPPNIALQRANVEGKRQVGEVFVIAPDVLDQNFLELTRRRVADEGYAAVEELEYVAAPLTWGIRIALYL